MRTRHFVMAAALLLIAAGVRAQEPSGADPNEQKDVPKTTVSTGIPDIPLVNQIDFGLRGTTFGSGSDQARFQRYRDMRDGGTIDLMKFSKDTSAYRFNFEANHVGYRDQRFAASFNNYGNVKASFEWNQVPLYYSTSTQTLYNQTSPGVFVLPDSLQTGLQNKTTSLVSAVTTGSVFDLQSKRNNAAFNLIYNATQSVDFNVFFKNSDRTGAQPYAISYGISSAVASEFAAPLDQRTTEFGASLQWSNDRGLAKLGYDGSFFRNNLPSLSVDNPLRVTDSPTAGPLFGRLAGAPNNNVNTGSALAAINLPAHSRATGYLSISNITNNTPLLPFTSNTALVSPTLDRTNADLTARVTSMNYSLTSRPTNYLWFNARYRQHEYDNRSDPFHVANGVNYDTSIVALNKDTELEGFTKRTFDADMSVMPFKFVAFRAGYTREGMDFANPSNGEVGRMIDSSIEDTGRVSADLTGVGWLTVRGVYEHSKRVGSGFDLQTLLDLGEQPGLRQFDIADRNKDSLRGIIFLQPLSQFSVNASAGVGKEDYPGTTFGLRNNDNHVYSVGADFEPIDKVSMGVNYGWEKYTALQASRTSNPLPAMTPVYLNDPTQTFNDPRRDWTDNSGDTVHTFDASIDLIKLIPKTEIKTGYSYSNGESTYVYAVQPNQTLVVAPTQLAPITNKLQRGTVDARYFLTQHVAIGLVYWYDKYDVTDFALGPQTSLALPATASPALMTMGNYYRPYSANTFWGRFTYLW